MDIIKLYGAGIEKFVPDEKMGYDFYKVANKIVSNPMTVLRITIEGDDICTPCKYYKDRCMDELFHIPEFSEKDVYNKAKT